MAPRRTYPVQIVRRVDPAELAACSDEEADRGEEDGFYGNQHYRDIRDIGWDEVAEAVEAEAALFRRFAEAYDLEVEAELYDKERDHAFLPEEDLWGLDIGVVGATLALSALGCTTVSSCNAGGFGGRHVAAFPYVAFFLPPSCVGDLLSLAEEADVGLDVISGGIARLFGLHDADLHRFAMVALRRHRPGS